MPRLTIPPDQKVGLTELNELDSSQVEQLATSLEAAPPKLYSFQLVRDVASRVPTIPASSLESILEAVGQIEFMRNALDAPRQPFMEDIREAVAAAGITSGVDAFMATLNRLLSAPSVTTTAKARALLTEGNGYCHSRVLTDVRPVFGATVEEAPKAALIVHHLVLSYHVGGPNTSDLIVSMDADDIDSLIEVLQRAQIKQRQLQQLLIDAKVQYIDPE